jgi:ribosomal protein L40E
MSTINITPNPRILEVITHNPMHPINAICELIDNSIDGFNIAKEKGTKIEKPIIDIILPGKDQINENTGSIIVKDNGPGLSREQANEAVRAGFSGNEAIGRLGLFGMGFNISTGKLGKKTTFSTARKEDKKLFSIVIDLPLLVKKGIFAVPVIESPKPSEDYSGVTVEISDWWEEGHQNHGFIKKLVGIGGPKLTEQIGRRYSSLLRKGLQVSVNRRRCPVFYHCAWGANRFVEKRNRGRIPARFDFSHVLRTEKRCYGCGSLILDDKDSCSRCGRTGNIKTRECSIRGWVGIQRFDHADRFGIDFIRNGRAILVGEKEAVFAWVPEKTGEKVKEYPIDSIFGRIIGEVHIDHVPTDFLKTDFQKTSPEWIEVIKFLRGESHFQPEKQKTHGEPENKSYLYLLFQGYRKVARFGRADMYMGFWDESKNGPSRISRDVEKELYEKFLNNEPGYGSRDDSEWWKYVEGADIRPAPIMKECPKCGVQCLKGAEVCAGCQHIFFSKKCNKCNQDIVQSAVNCQYCGTSQVPDEEAQWVCNSCMRRNPPDAFRCRRCSLPRGVEDPLKLNFLKENSNIKDELCSSSFSVRLPGDVSMSSIKLKVYYANTDVMLERDGLRLPAVIYCTANEMDIFIDPTHPIYNKYQDRPEDIVSIELAKWIWQNNQGKINERVRPLWSLSNLYYLIHANFWGKRVELDKDEVLKSVVEFFDNMRDALPNLLADNVLAIYENMDDNEQSQIIEQLYKNNLISKQGELRKSGEYLMYLPYSMVVGIFRQYPEKFFDGKFWKIPYEALDVPDARTLENIKKDTVGKYHRCLEDMVSFVDYRNPDVNYVRKINQTLLMVREYLT